MNIRFAKPTEEKKWNEILLHNSDNSNIAQSLELANLKTNIGWKKRLVVSDVCAMTIHERNIPLLGKLWYLPKGPGVQTIEELSAVVSELRSFAKRNGAFVVKIEPELEKNDIIDQQLLEMRLSKTHPIQPNSSTIVLDLSKETEKILQDLPQKSRHAIKRAYRDGLTAKKVEPTDSNLSIMFQLIQQTMAGKSVTMRDENYYKKFWKTFISNNMGALFFAYDGDKPIAGAFVLNFGNKATYKDGGSVREKTIYGASHALQWYIIEWLKTQDITSYDLCGTPPSNKIGDKNHPHYGIGLFKTSFNKTVTDYVGVYDIVIKPKTYQLWASFGERVICKFYAVILKKLFY